jgi:LEA14-like dessication related protein
MYKYSLFLLIFIFLTGCAGLHQQQTDVKVTLVNLRLLESTLFEQRFVISLRVQNRSPQSLSIHGMSFDIEINGKDFASGTSDQKTTIEAFTDEIIDVKMSSTLFGIIRQIQTLQKNQGQSLSYVISGRIYNGGLFGITFREADEFDFNQQPGLI